MAKKGKKLQEAAKLVERSKLYEASRSNRSCEKNKHSKLRCNCRSCFQI